jgi:opacity protein-like surface antigen
VGGIANPGWQSTVAPALVVDAGVRYMIFKNLSVDLSFRYRYAQPNFHFDFTDIHGSNTNLNFSPTYNLFSGMAGVAYHF